MPVARAAVLEPVALDVAATPVARAARPHLDAACFMVDSTTTCDADDGFPAVSADGKTVVMK